MDVIERLRQLDACAVSDALDTLGLTGATVGIRPLWPITGTVAGPTRTIRVARHAEGIPSMHIATPLIEVSLPGDVIVIDNGGQTDVSCWGGILTVAALSKGVAGVIIDGACRDIGESEEFGLPIFGRAVVPISARGRIVQEAMDVRVSIGSVVVEAHDYVIADRNGSVFIRQDDIDRVVAQAEKQVGREAEMIAEVRSGKSVQDVMHDKQFPGAR